MALDKIFAIGTAAVPFLPSFGLRGNSVLVHSGSGLSSPSDAPAEVHSYSRAGAYRHGLSLPTYLRGRPRNDIPRRFWRGRTEGLLDYRGRPIDAIVASEFLRRVKGVAEIPNLPLSRESTVFVCIPMCRELANADRLFDSWLAQRLPRGVRAEVIFSVNNRAGADEEVVRENMHSFERLSTRIRHSIHPSIGFHVVDEFSGVKALPESVTMGDIRNVAISPVIAHAFRTGEDAMIFSTDADTFPSPNLIAALHSAYSEERGLYGSVMWDLEIDPSLSAEERRLTRQALLVGSTDDILSDYLTYGEWLSPESLVGANTFYTIGAFLGVQGYSDDMRWSEDFEMATKFRRTWPHEFANVSDVSVTSMMRYSDRVDGDGAAMVRMKESGGLDSVHAGTTRSRAYMRRWLIDCLSEGLPFEMGVSRLNFLEAFPYLDYESLNAVAGAIMFAEGSTDAQRYDDALKAYRDSLDAVVRVSPGEALTTYEHLIFELLRGDEDFADIWAKIASYASSHGVPQEYVAHLALSEYALLRESR